MRMFILALAGALLSGAPVSLAKSRHLWSNVSVQLYNYASITDSYTIEVKMYDNVTGTVYFDNTVTLAPGQGALEGPENLTDAHPYVSVKYAQSPSGECAFFLTTPDGGGNSGCHTSALGSGTFSVNVLTQGYGTYEFDFNPGPGCI